MHRAHPGAVLKDACLIETPWNRTYRSIEFWVFYIKTKILTVKISCSFLLASGFLFYSPKRHYPAGRQNNSLNSSQSAGTKSCRNTIQTEFLTAFHIIIFYWIKYVVYTIFNNMCVRMCIRRVKKKYVYLVICAVIIQFSDLCKNVVYFWSTFKSIFLGSRYLL